MRRKYVRVVSTAARSSELWDRWRKGEGLKSIGRVLGEPSSCIFNHLRPSGGIRPVERTRSRLALTLAEREEISRGIAVGHSLRSIAGCLGRSPSTVSREIKRNGRPTRYRSAGAEKRAWAVAQRPKACKLATHRRLRRAVARKLERNWSPEQVAGWLKHSTPPPIVKVKCCLDPLNPPPNPAVQIR
jgi:IS30 family transposase